MTRCATDNRPTLIQRLDETVEHLTPGVAALLREVGGADEELTMGREGDVRTVSVPVRFPDGIGHGAVVARVFRYRTAVRVDIQLVHDRMLASSDGTPTSRHCFLNDFVASVMLLPDTPDLPAEFGRSVVTGVRAAVHAVEAHNRHHREPWGQVKVVAS